jgi:hypothetical protein
MISPKIAMMTAMMAVSTLGMTAVPVLAQQDISDDDSISQSITQSNEACTNTVVAISSASASDNDFSDDNTAESEVEVDADQSNKCKVYQSNYANQEAEIESENINFRSIFGDLFN